MCMYSIQKYVYVGICKDICIQLACNKAGQEKQGQGTKAAYKVHNTTLPASLSVATQRLSISLRSRKKASNALVVLTVASGEADDMLQLGVGDALRRALVSVCVTSLFFLVRASS